MARKWKYLYILLFILLFFKDKPNVNMSDYTVYDEEGHLVPLDSGLRTLDF